MPRTTVCFAETEHARTSFSDALQLGQRLDPRELSQSCMATPTPETRSSALFCGPPVMERKRVSMDSMTEGLSTGTLLCVQISFLR